MLGKLMAAVRDKKERKEGDYTGVDARGRRTTQSDSRVSDAAKAELPAYGWEGMTVGDIYEASDRYKQERKGRKEAVGYAKGGRIDGCAQRGKTKGRFV